MANTHQPRYLHNSLISLKRQSKGAGNNGLQHPCREYDEQMEKHLHLKIQTSYEEVHGYLDWPILVHKLNLFT